jgi:hypothetical protein
MPAKKKKNMKKKGYAKMMGVLPKAVLSRK